MSLELIPLTTKFAVLDELKKEVNSVERFVGEISLLIYQQDCLLLALKRHIRDLKLDDYKSEVREGLWVDIFTKDGKVTFLWANSRALMSVDIITRAEIFDDVNKFISLMAADIKADVHEAQVTLSKDE